jgi:hypothetical protein
VKWLHCPSEINGFNLNNKRHEASRHFRNKKRECLKDKIDELAMISKNKNIRDLYSGINEFMRCYKPSSNLVKMRILTCLQIPNILNRRKNNFSQLLNVYRVSDIGWLETHTAEPDPSLFEVDIATAKLKRYKSPGSDQILAELIQAGGELCIMCIMV